MPEDLLSDLKEKEDELEALVEGARIKAVSIKDSALNAARALKESKTADLEAELASMAAGQEDVIRAEVEKIEREGEAEVERMRAAYEQNIDRAVEEVIRYITGANGADK